MSPPLFLALLSAGFLLRLCSSACFSPNGSDVNTLYNVVDGENYSPCDSLAEVSMCCAIGPGRSDNQDQCREGGLCYNPAGDAWWRESCTDPTWRDPACTKLFVNGTGYNKTTVELLPPDSTIGFVTDVSLQPCEDGSWCYQKGESGFLCCRAGMGYFIKDGEETRQNPNATTTSSLSTTSTTPASTQLSPSSSNGLSSGASIGLGVGVGVGGAAVLVFILILCWRRGKRRTSSAEQAPLSSKDRPYDSPAERYKTGHGLLERSEERPTFELDSLPSPERRLELP